MLRIHWKTLEEFGENHAEIPPILQNRTCTSMPAMLKSIQSITISQQWNSRLGSSCSPAASAAQVSYFRLGTVSFHTVLYFRKLYAFNSKIKMKKAGDFEQHLPCSPAEKGGQ